MMNDTLPDRLRAIVGDPHCLTTADALAPYQEEQRGRFRGRAAAVVRPATTDEAAAVLRACADTWTPVVPQGGNTGLVGGAAAPEGAVVVATERLNRLRRVDPAGDTLTVEAGAVLADVQRAAADADRLFPLSLAAEGSARIGGNLAANAGGVHVLRYGMARDLVRGVEAVLPDGSVYSGLDRPVKDNTGYALDQLLVGSEGTLGLITAATLRLVPPHRQTATALAAVPDAESALALLNRARGEAGDVLAACELLPRRGLDFVTRHIPGARDPFDGAYPWFVLLELASPRADGTLPDLLATLLGAAFESGEAVDGVVASSEAQRHALWHLRESLPGAQKPEGGSIKHDVSVPVAAVPDFLARATAAAEAEVPGVRPVPFGHLGDGNIHFNLTQPEGLDRDAFLAHWDAMNRVVHDVVAAMGGSIAAEHGIGRLKPAELARVRDPVALDAMRRVKNALDPDGIMNPGVLFP